MVKIPGLARHATSMVGADPTIMSALLSTPLTKLIRPVSHPMTVGEIIDAIADFPISVTAFDGSSAGPTSGGGKGGTGENSAGASGEMGIHITKDGLTYIATAPGELGLARAYLTDNLRVSGTHPANPYDLFGVLRTVRLKKLSSSTVRRIIGSLAAMDAFRNLPQPPQEMVPFWQRAIDGLSRHSQQRDAESISHHYDVSNRFYELFLGPSMTYTCAYYPDSSSTLEEAQENKYRLIFDKLRLQPGDTLLDVGCGWGGMVRYAARHEVKTIGATLSREQAEWANEEIARQGLGDLAEVRFQDYRDIPESDFDAISAIGILEHIGTANYHDFFSFLFNKLQPGGLILNHCITRPINEAKTNAGPFLDRYIFPDGELHCSGNIIANMQGAGFEVMHEENLRPHYARTLKAWCSNLEENWDAACDEVSEATAKLYGVYMAGSAWGFDHNIVQLHQVLGVKPLHDGTMAVPERQWWES